MAINWQIFGSNNHKTTDLTRGVLERFTRRAPSDWFFADENHNNRRRGNVHIKTIANPRAIDFIRHPHYPIYFEGLYSVNENGKPVYGYDNDPVTVEKIAVHHYYAKSYEEFTKKLERGAADHNTVDYKTGLFEQYNRNEVFDDGILKYRAERAKIFQSPDRAHATERLLNALLVNLSPALLPNTPKDFYHGMTETFLTCRAVGSYLQTRLANETYAKFFEELALEAYMKSLSAGITLPDMLLSVSEVPQILRLTYPVVKEIRNAAREMIEQLKSSMQMATRWREFAELDYVSELLKE